MHLKKNMNQGMIRIMTGAGIGLIFFMISTFFAAFVLTKSDLTYKSIKIIIFVISMISAFITGFISKKKNKMKGIAAGAIATTILLCLIILIMLFVSGFHLKEEAFLLIPAAMSFGILGGIISSNQR